MNRRTYRRRMQTAGSVAYTDMPLSNDTYGNNMWGSVTPLNPNMVPGNSAQNQMVIPQENRTNYGVQQNSGPQYTQMDSSRVDNNPNSVTNVLSNNIPKPILPPKQSPNQGVDARDVMYGANVLGTFLATNNANRQNRQYVQSNMGNPLLNEATNDGRSDGVKYGYDNFQNGGKTRKNISMNKQQEAQILSAYLQQVPPQNRQAIMKQLGQLKQQNPQKYAQTVMQLAQQMQGQQQGGGDQQQQGQEQQAKYGIFMMQDGGQPQPQGGGSGGGQDAQMQQVIQKIIQLLQSGQHPQQVVAMLIKMGIPKQQATQLVQQVVQQMQQQQGGGGGDQQPQQGQQAPQDPTQQGQAMYGRRMQSGGYNPDLDYQQRGYFTQNYFPNFYKTPTGYMQDGGGQPQDPSQQGDPSQQQPDPSQGQQGQGQGQDGQMQQVIQQIVQMLQAGKSPQEVVAALVKMGIPQQQAIQLVQQVMQQMQQGQGGGGGQDGSQQDQQQQGAQQGQQPGMRMGGKYRRMGGRNY